MKLKDKVAIVTGASKGIGRAIAEAYAGEGASVVLASRSTHLLGEVKNKIVSNGGNAIVVPVDVLQPDSIKDMVNQTMDAYGKLDILVNNAGISMAYPSLDLPEAEWQRALDTNLTGMFYGCQAAARVMIPQGGGSIINISSMFGMVAAPGRVAYCASKAAANMISKVLAVEWGEHNIRVNAIAPGYTRTELVQGVIDKGMIAIDAIQKRTPLKRIGEVGDMIGIAVLLASDEASFLTGSVVNVDGGWVANGYL